MSTHSRSTTRTVGRTVEGEGERRSQGAATTRDALRRGLREADLTAEEERVLRMRAGVTEPEESPLAFEGQDHPELAARLARLEHEALRHVPAEGAGEDEAGTGEDEALKRRIIRGLRKI